MKSLSTRNISFVFRIWWEEGEIRPDHQRFWRGWIQHVRSGESAYIQDMEGLISFIERWTGSLQPAEAGGAPASTLALK